MAVNQKHITIASYNYLLEISAIPQNARLQFLNKLKERRNSAVRKNVMLLTLIYEYIDNGRMSEWDPEYVCGKCGINSNALHIQKTRLLKRLREYLFEWKEKEEVIVNEFNEKYSGQQFINTEEQYITLMAAKARKMASIGMLREAKLLFFKLEKLLKTAHISNSLNYLTLAEAYEFLAYYYQNKRQNIKTASYAGKAEKLFRKAEMFKPFSCKEDKADFMIKYHLTQMNFETLKWYSDPNAGDITGHAESIYKIAVSNNNIPARLKALHTIAISHIIKNNYTSAINKCKEGFELAQSSHRTIEKYTFAAMIFFIKKKTNPENPGSNTSILNYYYKVKELAPYAPWTLYLENSIVMTYYPEKRKDILNILREQITSNIMYGDILFSVYYQFTLDTEKYNEKMLGHFDIHNVDYKGYLELKRVDNTLLDDVKRMCLNAECYHKKINDFGLSWMVHNLQLLTFFFSEDGYEYNEMTSLVITLEHMKRSSKIIPGLTTYELMRLCFKMLDHKGNNQAMLNKYELKFHKMLNKIKSNTDEITITDYMILASLSRRLRSKEITHAVKSFYHWLNTNHRSILAPIYRELKKITPNFHTIVGKEHAA